MDDLIKVTAGLVAVAAVIVLFVYGAVFLGIPIVIGYLRRGSGERPGRPRSSTNGCKRHSALPTWRARMSERRW